MFELYADKNRLSVRQREQVTSGSVNVYRARFEFSPDWDGLTRTAVFRGGGAAVSVLLDPSGECAVPWEALTKPKVHLWVGVYGTRGEDVVLPTVWADCGFILEGVTTGENARPPTPGPYEQILGELADIRETVENLVITGGGVTDHRLLTNRDAGEQHPVEAITGLTDALSRIPRPMTADELRKILMN